MNPIVSLALKAALSYLESHPQQIEAIVTAALDYLTAQIPVWLAAAQAHTAATTATLATAVTTSTPPPA